MTEGLSHRQLAKRAQIADAARRLFLDQGFAGTSMDAVTAEAGVSKQTLYSYFPTKTDLLIEVINTTVSKLALTPPQAAQLHTREDLRNALIGFSAALTQALMRPEGIALVRLVLGEAFRVPELRRAFRDALPGQVLGRTVALLRQASEAGLIDATDLDLASRMFVGPVMTYVALDGFLSVDPDQPPERAKLERLTDAFLATVAVK
ncbi:TetR/AcrR family transcriptional regulator [Propionicimonas sp.]|uniref:TetR/AcrR family transcriptional regulator n=1 Tax=Propionicimonas sp. TaxID=1955623 RepID=UPI00180A755E|nr:TetR/AcrR family transcriptional regulator [Propionicimonas sp.]MBU3977843.1 TetR/AcrR family transcriptional regulator [Actinomycetota bacterium]MBA3021933.1 TetR/AcrR family transcriptional regulator [Propionicimonas sp.]MBU3987620.1 TetR/AcrR family transcriptional regulator [Actinomycetota bacterium]MBU4007342.1 TetR/AcrR family transcriptional regulator [Actinomycetota bacterium]MBU4065712.1 TetR/AcrR family transcriptional regulator [Actinomycetota bacterium]